MDTSIIYKTRYRIVVKTTWTWKVSLYDNTENKNQIHS